MYGVIRHTAERLFRSSSTLDLEIVERDDFRSRKLQRRRQVHETSNVGACYAEEAGVGGRDDVLVGKKKLVAASGTAGAGR